MNQSEKWDFFQAQKPGTKIVTCETREQWVKLQPIAGDSDLWTSTETGAVHHFSYLADEIFIPETTFFVGEVPR